ncbi:MAG: hypothetical protein WCC21_08675 [Candidatus Acidiferrales bacterium]
MFNAIPDFPPPKKLLHDVCFFCLFVWGGSATVVASHVGSVAAWFESTRQLALLSFFGLLTFGFFYIQYAAVERFVGRELNETLGHLQASGGTALFLVAVVGDLVALVSNHPQFAALGLGDTILLIICILGEGAFLVNVMMTFVLAKDSVASAHPVIPISRPATTRAGSPIAVVEKIASRFDWSSSPAVIFGVAAAFFILAGTFLIEVSPARMPFAKEGAIIHVSPGYLWLPLAVPFAVFAVAYWLIEIFTGWKFDRSATRMNFLCTVLAAIDAIRIYWAWSVTTSTAGSRPPGVADFFGVFAFLALAAATLLWNVWAAQNAPARAASLQTH